MTWPRAPIHGVVDGHPWLNALMGQAPIRGSFVPRGNADKNVFIINRTIDTRRRDRLPLTCGGSTLLPTCYDLVLVVRLEFKRRFSDPILNCEA